MVSQCENELNQENSGYIGWLNCDIDRLEQWREFN